MTSRSISSSKLLIFSSLPVGIGGETTNLICVKLFLLIPRGDRVKSGLFKFSLISILTLFYEFLFCTPLPESKIDLKS